MPLLRRISSGTALALLSLALPALATDVVVPSDLYSHIELPDPPLRTGGFALVLGGGGARGMAHIGVIEVMEEEGLVPDFVVGTSMGAILGALYASGYTPAELRALVRHRRWLELFFDDRQAPGRIQGGWTGLDHHQLTVELKGWDLSPPAGASYGQAVETLVGQLTADALFQASSDFNRLPIPFRAVSTDIVTAEAIVPDRGSLARATRASSSLPFIFVPVEMEGRTLMDGGVVDNLPVGVARTFGFTRSVIVDVSNIFLPREGPPRSLGEMLERVTQLSQRAQNNVIPTEDELLLRVDLHGHNALSFWSAESLIEAGRQEAEKHREAFRELKAKLESSREPPQKAAVGPVRIRQVHVRGNRRMSDWSVRRRLGVFPGDRLELEELHKRVGALANQPVIHNAWISLSRVEADEPTADVTLRVIERTHPTLELGGHYITDDGLAGFTRLRLDNLFGLGEGQVLSARFGREHLLYEAELSQHVRGSRQIELREHAYFDREWLELYDGDDVLDTRVIQKFGGWIGTHLRPRKERVTFVAGVRIEDAEYYQTSRTGPKGEERLRALELGLETGLPGGLTLAASRGVKFRMTRALPIADSTTDFWSLQLGSVLRWPIGGPFAVSTKGGAFVGEDVATPWLGKAGGPHGWLGLKRDSVVAQDLLWVRGGFEYVQRPELRYELAASVGWSGEPLTDARPVPGIGAFGILDTPVGPLRLGWSVRRKAQGRVTVQVGYEF